MVGHSSGELLALSAAGVFPADRVLEQKLARLGAIFRNFETSGDLPEAHLVAVAADRERVAAICRAVAAGGTAVAMDNCPHQVVLAVPTLEFDRLVARLRAESILWEDLPFSRAYHTPSFEPVVAPIADFFAEMTFNPPEVPIYSCASSRRMPDDLTSIRDLAVRQWTTAVAFRETIETMHSDGLRLFVDVGARGNLAGFVEDILRGKPSFAVATNLPRRSGLAQLNHLVASLFAHGVPLNTDYLYARRRPRAIDWNAAEPPARATVELKIGFPEMRLSEPLLASLRAARPDDPGPEPNGDEPLTHAGLFPVPNHHPTRNGSSRHHDAEPQPAAVVAPDEPRFDALQERFRDTPLHPAVAHLLDELSDAAPELPSPYEDAMLGFQQTMQEFLQTQQEIISAYLGASPAAFTECVPDPGEDLEPSQARLTTCDPVQVSASRATSRVTSGPRPGPWAGEVRRLVPGHEIETLVVLERPRRSDCSPPHVGRPQGLRARRVIERSSGPAFRRHGRDDRPGRRPGRHAGSRADRPDAGPRPQMGAL